MEGNLQGNLQFSKDENRCSFPSPKALGQLICLKWKFYDALSMNMMQKVSGLVQQEL